MLNDFLFLARCCEKSKKFGNFKKFRPGTPANPGETKEFKVMETICVLFFVFTPVNAGKKSY